MYSAGEVFLEGDVIGDNEPSCFTCTSIDSIGHREKILIHDDKGELRDKVLVWLNASPERQQSFINEDDLKQEEPVDPLRYVFADVIQSVKLAEAANDLEDYRSMKKLLKVLKKAYPETAEEFKDA